MGAPFWSEAEKDYFRDNIIPRSCFANGHYEEGGEDLADLAVQMQKDLDATGESRRKYDKEILYQHWYQKVRPGGRNTKSVQEQDDESEATQATSAGPSTSKAGTKKKDVKAKEAVKKTNAEINLNEDDDSSENEVEHEVASPVEARNSNKEGAGKVKDSLVLADAPDDAPLKKGKGKEVDRAQDSTASTTSELEQPQAGVEADALSRADIDAETDVLIAKQKSSTPAAKKRALEKDAEKSSGASNSKAKRARFAVDSDEEEGDSTDSDLITPYRPDSVRNSPSPAPRKNQETRPRGSSAIPTRVSQSSPSTRTAAGSSLQNALAGNPAQYNSPYPPQATKAAAGPATRSSKAQDSGPSKRKQLAGNNPTGQSTSHGASNSAHNGASSSIVANFQAQMHSQGSQMPRPNYQSQFGPTTGSTAPVIPIYRPYQVPKNMASGPTQGPRPNQPHGQSAGPNHTARPSGPAPNTNNPNETPRLGAVHINGTVMLPFCPCCNRGF